MKSQKNKTLKKKNLIIDTNLLLLLIIGSVENGLHIKSSNRLNKYSKDDFEKVLKIMLLHDEVYITPYIAAETSNLIDLTGRLRIEAYEITRELFGSFKQLDSNIVKDCAHNHFLNFGLTDNSLICLAADYFILTDDHEMLTPLYTSGPDNIIPYYQ